jgi:hypothetical protein
MALTVVAITADPAVNPPSAVAAVFDRAGRDAARAPTVVLGHGDYLYNEVRALVGGYYLFGNGNPAERSYIAQIQRIQTWEAADGSDRKVVTYDGPLTFPTAASRVGYVTAGEPQIAFPTNRPYSASEPLGQYEEFGGPGVLAVPDDVSRLPTDPTALAKLINSDETDLNEVTSDPRLPVSPAYTFATAAKIVATPALGFSSALRTALYKLLASVPGTRSLGRRLDQSGRTGTEIVGPLGGDGYSRPGGANGVREELIIDRADGAVLERGQTIADPSRDPVEFTKYVGDARGDLFEWTDYLASGVVDAPSATLVSSVPAG